MTYIKIILLQVVLCGAAAAFAQDAEQHRSAIRNNSINQKRTVTILYNKGKQTDSFVSANTSFNRLGFPLQQTIFNKYGTIQGRFVSQYQSDSLEVKESSYDSSGNYITETVRTYNTSGQLSSMKAILHVSNRTVHHMFEYESDGLVRKDYMLDEDTKKLLSVSEFNNNREWIRSTYYDLKGNLQSISTHEFDATTKTRKNFTIKNNVKRLRSSQVYSGNLLTEELHYYDNAVTLSNGYGSTQTFKKGDTRKVLFEYNDTGLLKKQVESVNGQITLQLIFEYYQ